MNKILLLSLCLTLAGQAADTRFWQQYDPDDYDKATLKQLALRSDGRLTLAPVFKELYDTSTPYLWAVATDSKGNLYAGGGAPGASAAKLFHLDPNGKARTLTELPGLEIHAIAIDRQDRVYAATSPDGKVYRVDANGKADVFYDPKAKYVWAMGFSPSGDLYVATGDKGEIHKVSPSGQGSVFFQSDETHARSMAIDRQGNLIVGTEPAGLVLRISPKGEGFVLHQSSKREVTAVAIAPDGVIYAAAVGNKAPATAPAPPPIPVVVPTPAPVAASAPRVQSTTPPTIAPAPSVGGGSELIRIETDGAPRRVWSHGTDLVYTIAFDAQNRPLLGTGNRGRIYRIDSPQLSTTLVSATSTQITSLAPGLKGAVYAVTANIGRIFRLGPELEQEGTLESDVLDAGAFSYWGRARWEGDASGGQVTLETRSGNLDRPQKNWSDWSRVPLAKDTGRIASPPSRFLQYRLKLAAAPKPGAASPVVTMVELAYLSKNVAPIVQAVESTPANYKFPAATTTVSSGVPATINLPAIGQRSRASGSLSLDTASSTLNHSKGWIGARWSANDENGDPLLYKLEIRGTGETEWKLLKDHLRDRHYSWDSTAFADGQYQVRVTASDAPGNPPNEALTAQLESEPFLIDNTAPQIANLSAAIESGKLMVRWQARDKASVIERAEYSLNGGDWTVAQPVSRLADSLTLDYAVSLTRPGPGEVTVAIRITDEFENQTVEKVTVK